MGLSGGIGQLVLMKLEVNDAELGHIDQTLKWQLTTAETGAGNGKGN